MRVFVTGATGFIGSAVVAELIGAGHRVLGLARSDSGARALVAAGAEVHRGSLEDLASLARGAEQSDAVIHTAFIHDFSDFIANCRTDERAIEALGAALAGSDRPLIVTAGTGAARTEEDSPGAFVPRKSEAAALAFVSRGVRAMVVRLPPSVHGDGDHGFVAMLIDSARKSGFAIQIGEGANRWPAVHRLDAARLYRLALEQGSPGARFHGVADEGIPIRQIAEVIGRRLGVPVVSKTAEEAVALLGFIGHVLAIDGPSSSTSTQQQQLGWRPTRPGLIADLEEGRYFDT